MRAENAKKQKVFTELKNPSPSRKILYCLDVKKKSCGQDLTPCVTHVFRIKIDQEIKFQGVYQCVEKSTIVNIKYKLKKYFNFSRMNKKMILNIEYCKMLNENVARMLLPPATNFLSTTALHKFYEILRGPVQSYSNNKKKKVIKILLSCI